MPNAKDKFYMAKSHKINEYFEKNLAKEEA